MCASERAGGWKERRREEEGWSHVSLPSLRSCGQCNSTTCEILVQLRLCDPPKGCLAIWQRPLPIAEHKPLAHWPLSAPTGQSMEVRWKTSTAHAECFWSVIALCVSSEIYVCIMAIPGHSRNNSISAMMEILYYVLLTNCIILLQVHRISGGHVICLLVSKRKDESKSNLGLDRNWGKVLN